MTDDHDADAWREISRARACAGLAPQAIAERFHTQTIALFKRALSRIQ